MRIAVLGAGGVGGYFGGRLAFSGEEVIFIARGDHLRAMQVDGLRVDSLQGDFQLQPVQATDDPQQVGQVDVILVAVKAWQVVEAAQLMLPMIGSTTFVLPVLNGVEAPTQLAAAIGEEWVLGGLCRISSYIASPGYIRHVGIEPHIAFGELDNRASQRCERLKAAFQRAGVSVEIPADIWAAIWDKFLFIASLSGVGAVTRAPVGVMRSLPGTRQLLEQAMGEIIAVAQAHQVNLPADAVTRKMDFIDRLPEDTLTSMQRDMLAGRPSELEAQTGAVVRLGRARGIPTPVNSFLYDSLLPQELRARGEI
jgi:2-dehydropantoate 2-reductase